MTNWQLQHYPSDVGKTTFLARNFNVDPLLINVLHARGIQTGYQLSKFFFPAVQDLHDPYQLNDMTKAIARVQSALQNNETIVVFGDYDADGITSTTILTKLLSFFNGHVIYKIPLREEGYGITKQAVARLHMTHQPSLIITVDNGSNAHEAIKEAKKYGIDVIVTDHHAILHHHPASYAFINPKRSDSTYPFDGLCGAGVALKFAQALFMAYQLPWEQHMHLFIELAAIGTVADCMELIGENRVITWLGLKKLNHNPSLFFKTLCERLKIRTVTSETIGFSIAPLFNSLGRIADANTVIPFFLSKTVSDASFTLLIETNEKRKELTRVQSAEAERIIHQQQLTKQGILVVCGDFHEGVIGIIAARMVTLFKKPAIILTKKGKGSARSLDGFSIIDAITSVQSYLRAYGGHPAAAGLTIDPALLDDFSQAIQQYQPKAYTNFCTQFYQAEIGIDSFPKTLLNELTLLEPFGIGNKPPLFYSPTTPIQTVDIFGKIDKHAKLNTACSSLVLFGQGDTFSTLPANTSMDLVYSVANNAQFLLHDYHILACAQKKNA